MKKLILFLCMFLVLIRFSSAITIDFNPSIPLENSSSNSYHILVNATINTTSELSSINYTINGVSYMIIDSTQKFKFQFDNLSFLNETNNQSRSSYNTNITMDMYNAKWASDGGRYDGAFDYNGFNSYGAIPDSVFVADGVNFTAVTLCMYGRDFGGEQRGFFYKNGFMSFTGNGVDIYLYAYNLTGGGLNVLWNVGGSFGSNSANQRYTQYCWAVNSTNMKWSKDGIPASNKSISFTGIARTAGQALYLGYGRGTNFNYFDGTIDEFEYYNRSLSDDEIALKYRTKLKRVALDQWTLEINQFTNVNSSNNISIQVTDVLGNINTSSRNNITTNQAYCVGANYNFSCGMKVNQSCTLNGDLVLNSTSLICLNVTNTSITLNGAGYELRATKTGMWLPINYGIYNYGFDSVTIKNFNIKDFDYGVYLYDSSNYNVVDNNTIINSNYDGMAVNTNAGNTNFTNNQVYLSGRFGIYDYATAGGINLYNNIIKNSHSADYYIWVDIASKCNNNWTNNTGTGGLLYYKYLGNINLSNLNDSNYSNYIFCNVNNLNVQNMSLGNTNNYRMGNGILIYESTNLSFNNLNITNQRYGFNNGVRGNNLTISNVNIFNTTEGIYMSYGNPVTIQNAKFIMTREAIRATSTNVINLTVKDASIYQTRLGIQSSANYNNFTNILIDTFRMRGYYQVGGLRPLFENITIRNGGASITAGIQLDNNGAGCYMNNIDIRNIVSGTADILMGTGSGSNCVINNVTLINTTTNSGFDIRGSSNYITNVFMNKSIATGVRGINSFYYGVNNTFKNIQMYNVYGGFGSSFTTYNAKGMNVENIYVNRVALAGFEMTGSMFNATIKNFTVDCGGGQYGVYITNNANISNYYDNITSRGCTNAGVVFHNSSNQNIRDINVSGVTTNYGAILYWTTSSNNTITRLNSQGNKYGVYAGQTNGDNWLIDSIINASITTDIISTANNKPATNYFLNLSYNKSRVSALANQTFYFKWYVDVYANYSNGTAVNGANVSAWDVYNALKFNTSTNSNGLITRQNLTEYYQNVTGQYYLSNYTINATVGSITLSQIANLTTNLFLWFEFTLDSCTPPSIGDWLVDCEDNCSVITPKTIIGRLILNGTGIFNISSTLNVTNQTWKYSGCKIFKYAIGKLI